MALTCPSGPRHRNRQRHLTTSGGTQEPGAAPADCSELPAHHRPIGKGPGTINGLAGTYAVPRRKREIALRRTERKSSGLHGRFGHRFLGVPASGGFFPGKPYVDRGISGQTTPQMLIRFLPDVIELQPKVVVILAGTNDLAGNTGPMTLAKQKAISR